ncbi:T9SS type A sorting domain-containing protein [Chryseobacterium sp.]|uniref:T9SS type A sorting domain-containing protein n=1 Tax=Chryseobacterium sp. TaxID=1871047 RepID=UPI001AFE73A2|nr:T9SS type A sorting domain-containing protein [Chryseobacterium sp.]MBO9690162.1 T9SS type A sorting domain-containing protein [Chryseobacterium sp.]
MIKKLVLLFLLSIISFYQCNVLKGKENTISLLLPPASVTVTDITPTSATVSWTPQIGTGSTVSYNKVGLPGSGGTNYTTSNSITITNLTQCTTYEVKVSYVQAGGGYSAPVIFTTPMWYCMENSTATITPYLYASNITLNATDLPSMTSSSTGTKAYADYRSDPTRKVKLVRGSTNNAISVTKAGPATQNPTTIGIWIDYNGDRAFDSTERILYSSNSTDMNPTATFNVPLQAGQVDCKVAMRVISNTTPYFSNCGPTAEIQDYEVEFIDAVSLNVNEREMINREINIYPNPVGDILNISGVSEATDYEIYNAAGQKSGEGKIYNYKIDVHHLSKGVYFIHLKDKAARLKFIKK